MSGRDHDRSGGWGDEPRRADRRRDDYPEDRRRDEDRREPPRRDYDDDRRAPPRSSGRGGWDDEEPRAKPSSGGWDEPAPRSKSSGGGWDEPAPKKSSGGGGWDDEPAPKKSSGGGGWDDAPAPRSKSSGGGWDEPAPKKSSGGGGWDDEPAPKKSSGGGGWDEPAPKKSSGGGGWDEPAPAKSSGGGGWDEPAPKKSSGGGGWDEPAPKKSSGGGGWDEPAPKKSSGGDDWDAPKSSGGDAWGSKSESGGGGGGDGCRNCGEEGHFARECPNPKKGGSGCRNCGEEGHFARECTNPKKEGGGGGGGGGCHICGEEGHFARECPKAGEGGGGARPDSPDDECWRCGGMGHTAQNCTSRIECGNVPGKSLASKHNQLYTNDLPDDAEVDEHGLAAKDGEREEELFGTHVNTGIQFEKYSKIAVEVYGEKTPPPLQKFSDLTNLGPVITNNLILANWQTPTPIQKYALPIAFDGRDIMGCAQTGSGKTAAFLLPIIHSLLKVPVNERRGETVFPGALIVVPVRELAQQIHIEAIKFTYRSTLKSVVLYGGSGSRDQRDALKRGCDILIGTPGRLLDFMRSGEFDLSKLKFLCFDEADRMLDLGFGEDMQVLLGKCPPIEKRQTLMFSATFPEDVQELAKAHLKADHVLITVGRVGQATPTVRQQVFQVEDYDKFDKLVELFHENPVKTLIFVGRKQTAEDLKAQLSQLGVPLETIHGDKDQYRREEALSDFKRGTTKVLIATDVAARGLDIPYVGHVINYDMPQNIDDYVHRIGRTGRVGHEGLASSFYNSRSTHMAAELFKILEEQGQECGEFLAGDAEANPTGPRKVFQPKPKFGSSRDTGASSGGNEWGNEEGGGEASSGAADPWGSESAPAKSGGGGWDEPAPKKSSGGGGWDEPAPKKSSGGGGWDEPAPAKSSGGGGWDEPAPKKSSGGGGWDEPAPKKSSGGGGWDDAPAPAPKKSSGGWGEEEEPAPKKSSGGWGDDAPAPKKSSGGWGDDAPASSGGWGDDAPASSGGGGW